MRLLLLFTLFSFSMFAQDGSFRQPDSLELSVFPDEEPEFPGGMVELQKFIVENIVYPESFVMDDMVGKIYLSFIVFRDGSVGEVKVERAVGESYTKMAIDVLEKMPNWLPARKNGIAIDHKVFFPLNIHFY